MFKFFAAIANIKYLVESFLNYVVKPLQAAWKAYNDKKREDAYQDRIDNRTEVGNDIVVESKKEPTEESDEALRNLHRKS
jgi:hypothetical protein